MKEMLLGVAYYPEVWDISEIEKDIEKMKEVGINCVRMGEFAWRTMEPQEGVYDFAFFVSVIEKFKQHDIKVVMCTPSATPPKWLTDTYEETLQMYSNGKRAQFGGRCHTCKSSNIMRQKNRIVVEEMCKALKNQTNIIGWQIDNEIYPYQDGCFCPICLDKFRKYLSNKYVSIENLNRKWKTARWSLTYSSFNDIIAPRHDTWSHPSLWTEWNRFQMLNIIEYVNEQSEIIKKYFNVPVGTDMMPELGVDYNLINQELDVVQFNHYESQDRLQYSSVWYDYLRPIKSNRFWVTETQAGWNGSVFADGGHRDQGNCYVNTVLPFLKGAEMNLYWLWRTHPCGHELGHGAVLSSSGRFNVSKADIIKAGHDINKIKEYICQSTIQSDIAIHFSTDAYLNFQNAPIIKGMDYKKFVTDFAAAFTHMNVDMIDPCKNIDQYKFLFSPFLSYIDENDIDRIIRWVNKGGTWVVGPMSGIMTDYAAKLTDTPFGMLENFFGVYTKYQIPLHNNDMKIRLHDGTSVAASLYYDAFETTDSESLAEYDGGVLKGLSALTQKKFGKGKIVSVGTVLEPQILLNILGIKADISASENIEIVKRTGKKPIVFLAEEHNRPGTVFLNRKFVNILDGEQYEGNVKLNPYQIMALIEI